MNDRLALNLIEIFTTALVAGLTSGAGLLALVHERNWIDTIFVFSIPFLTTLGAGLRNLYKDKPSNL